MEETTRNDTPENEKPGDDKAKADLLAALEEGRRPWLDLIAAAGSGRMERGGAMGAWSLKDLAAHLAAYVQFSADRLEQRLHGETYIRSVDDDDLAAFAARYGVPDFGSPRLNDDMANGWVQERWAERPLDEALDYEAGQMARLVELVQQSPAALLAGPALVDARESVAQAILSNTVEHYAEHVDEARKWLASFGV